MTGWSRGFYARLFEIDPDAAALGRRHAGYGAVPPHYASVAEALLHALATTLGPAFTPEVRAAWAEAYTLVAAVMRRAAEATRR